MTARRGAAAGLVVGLGMALAANLTYAVPRGPVVVGLGVACPLVLPLTLYLRTIFSVNRWWERVARETAMVAVTAPAVCISYVHTYSLVLAAEPSWPVLALIAPLSSDGVAGMSTMALHWATRPTAKVVNKSAPKRGMTSGHAHKTAPATPTKVAAPRRPVAVPTPLDGRRSGRSEMAAWLAEQEPRSFSDEVDAVRTQFGCSFSTAKRVRADVRRATA